MNTEVVNIICTAIIALTGIAIAVYFHKKDVQRDRMKSDIKRMEKNIEELAWNIVLYYDLEEEYLKAWINAHPDRKKGHEKIAFRKKVEDKWGRKITITGNKARKEYLGE